MDKLKYIKIEHEDGTLSENVPIGADASNIDVDSSTTLDAKLISMSSTLSTHTNQVSTLQSQVLSLASGGPAGVYNTVSALTSADPDHSKIYVVTANGHWYYYNSGWQDGGVYQGTTISENIIDRINLNDKLKDVYDNFLCNNLLSNPLLYGTSELYTKEKLGYSYKLVNSGSVPVYYFNIKKLVTSFYYSIMIKAPTGTGNLTFAIRNNTGTGIKTLYIPRDGQWHKYTGNINNVSNVNFSFGLNSVGEVSFKNVIFSEQEINYSSIIEQLDYLEEHMGEISDNSISLNKLDNDLQELFDYSYETLSNIWNSGYMQTNGTVSSYTGSYTVKEVIPGEKYRITSNYGYDLRQYILMNNDTVISVFPTTSIAVGTRTNKVTIPENVNKMYVNTYNQNAVIIEKAINLKIKDVSNNILANKSIFFYGDSITAGNGSWAQPNTIAGNNNMTSNNYAVGGMCYGVVTGRSDNTSNNILLRIRNTLTEENKPDYILLQGGVNDAFRGYTLGTVSTSYTDTLEENTFSGAFEAALRYVLTTAKGSKIGFIANAKIPRLSSLGTYLDRAKEICNKYSVPVLDFYNNSGLCAGIQEINDTYYIIDSDYSTEHSGGTHPTAEGYAKYLNNKVEAFLKSL